MNQLQYDLQRLKLAIREFFSTLEHDPDYWWARLLFWAFFWIGMWVIAVCAWYGWQEKRRYKRLRKKEEEEDRLVREGYEPEACPQCGKVEELTTWQIKEKKSGKGSLSLFYCVECGHSLKYPYLWPRKNAPG